MKKPPSPPLISNAARSSKRWISEVTSPAHAGIIVEGNHHLLEGKPITFSRMLRGNAVTVPTKDTVVHVGDIFRARRHASSNFRHSSPPSDATTSVDLDKISGDIHRMELVVTRTHVLRKSLRELDLIRRTGVTIGRVNRAGVDLVPTASLKLAFADQVTVVGPAAGLKIIETELGNCHDTLNRSQLVPIFLGIVLGVVVGSIPFRFPGQHATLRIGLAGGPLLAAIALSQFGNIGSIVWYMPTSANQLFRDFGLAVFLACVGLQAGDHFLQHAIQGAGISLLLWGAAITTLPVFAVGCFALKFLKMNFITLSGWVAGAMTSSPALLFADEMAQSDAPAVAYAAVAPLAMLVPIICAQMLAIFAQ